MDIIHSCWTAPMTSEGRLRWNITNQIETNLWLYGYSVDYLQRLNQRIDLFTDSYGATVFDCLPYNNIYTTLDELNDKVNERFWSAGKIKALEQAPLGTIHIDGDVFLKKHEVLKALELTGHDCVVQMAERMSVFMASYADVLPMFIEAVGNEVEGFRYNLKEALNAGVLGFNNKQMKDDFINGYWSILNSCQGSKMFMETLASDKEKRIEPNVVAEQYFLKSLAETKGYKIKHLLNLTSNNFNDDWQTMNQQAEALGFAHAWGSSKYRIIPTIKENLKQRNHALYQAICNKIGQITSK